MSSTQTSRANGTPGAGVKLPVKTVTTANITLSGEQTINGYAVVAGDRVFVKDQSTATENGIYVASAGAWSRADDFDSEYDTASGFLVVVGAGSDVGDIFSVTFSGSYDPGTTTLTITNRGASGSLDTGPVDVSGGPLTVTGSDSVLQLQEVASAPTDTPGEGQFWVKTDTPNRAFFTDDTGRDIPLSQFILQDAATADANHNGTINTLTGFAATLTADRYFVLPELSSKRGDIIGVKLDQDADVPYVIDINSGAFGSIVDGTDYSSGSIEGRLYLRRKDDALYFLCNGNGGIGTTSWSVLSERAGNGYDERYAITTAATPDADQTVRPNTLLQWNPSTITANRVVTLPELGVRKGDRVGIVLIGDAASGYYVDIATGSANNQINGAWGYTTGSLGRWRMFMRTDSIWFRCVKAGGANDTDWVIESEELLPVFYSAYATSAVTTNTGGTWTTNSNITTLDESQPDATGWHSSGVYTIPRDGFYRISVGHTPNSAVPNNEAIGVRVYRNGAFEVQYGYNRVSHSTSTTDITCQICITERLSAGDTIENQFKTTSSNDGAAAGRNNYLQIEETRLGD